VVDGDIGDIFGGKCRDRRAGSCGESTAKRAEPSNRLRLKYDTLRHPQRPFSVVALPLQAGKWPFSLGHHWPRSCNRLGHDPALVMHLCGGLTSEARGEQSVDGGTLVISLDNFRDGAGMAARWGCRPVRCSVGLSELGRAVLIGLVAEILFIAGCGLDSIAPATSGGASTSLPEVTTPAEYRVHLSGWLHIIWNGEPRFILIDDQGAATRIVIDGALTRAFGGPRRLNQRRVTITGERVAEPAEAVRVLSIELERESK